MADLEDFFAKRDKKKSKGKKFDTSEDLAKVVEQKAKERKKMETGKSNYTQEGGRVSPGPGLPANDDDEWLEAEEKKPDYTGLKIQELVLSDDDDVDAKSQDGKASGDEGANEGPWNKKKEAKPKEEESPKEDKEAEDKETSEDKSEESPSEEGSKDAENDGGKPKYVPPNQRRAQQESAPSGSASSGAAYVPPSRRTVAGSVLAQTSSSTKKKGAPTLGDEESFPSLG